MLDAHASGKLTGTKLDNAMAGMAADYVTARVKSRTLSPEQESAYSLRAAAAQACFAQGCILATLSCFAACTYIISCI